MAELYCDIFQFPKLLDFNYSFWKADNKVILMNRECWEFICGTAVPYQDSASVKSKSSSLVFGYVYKVNRNKLQSPAKLRVLVGYALRTKGYRSFIPQESKVIENIHMKIDETKNGNIPDVNAQTIKDKYPIPCILDFTSELHGCEIFSHVNLVKALHQIPIALEDIHKTALHTIRTLRKRMRMPLQR
ncbi:transposon Ty3-I Gag-Pol polyprotein [Caerostris extrusa]|uniref:Transposon Ty3-I Gag-Pol polyprotein n=1 Tax=Caerostris extrusa TaxID=172846 RepID=A0AAV4RNW4_CAEEX|nr:transposon Ty3-I Gag-Pol polyprotein [Caerostris extrusa]